MTFNITAVATAAVQPEQAQHRRQPMREPVLAPIARPHQCHNCLPDAHAMQPRMTAVQEVCTHAHSVMGKMEMRHVGLPNVPFYPGLPQRVFKQSRKYCIALP